MTDHHRPRSAWPVSEWEFREAARRIADALTLKRGERMPALRLIAADYGVSVRTLWRWAKYDVREVQVGKYRALFILGTGEPSRVTRWEKAA